ncbi:MAG TPA: 3D domain-containing protein [Blastocatellia bacterium]|nr:3D domain-containing protein [Blastocatellia bacterium]
MVGASAAVDANKGTADRLSNTDKSELQDFHATAYCLKGRTASGQYTRRGVIAADPRVLPIGTVVQIQAGRYTGTYTVLDTGGRIKGRKIDVYVPTYDEARRFGRQRIQVKVLGRAKKSDPARKGPVRAAL